jgi:hypothetical protein
MREVAQSFTNSKAEEPYMTRETKQPDLADVKAKITQAVGEGLKGGSTGPIEAADGFGSCVATAAARGVEAGLHGKKLDVWVGTFINICHALYD